MLTELVNKISMQPERVMLLSITILLVTAAMACQHRESRDDSRASASTATTQDKNAPIESWLGKWTGPEGTFLEISKTAQGYQVTIQKLDGPRTFPAEPTTEGLQFARDGKTETVHVGNGEDTGMKWLLEKKRCLVIKTGEGYCRD